MRRLILGLLTGVSVACAGGGGEEQVPNPVAPGETVTISLCGSTTEPRAPCADQISNLIQFRVGGQGGLSFPCYSFALLNQSLTDLGSSSGATYDFTGFRPGTYAVTGQVIKGSAGFTFWHNTSTSAIGVVPSSIQSLSGPVNSSNQNCS